MLMGVRRKWMESYAQDPSDFLLSVLPFLTNIQEEYKLCREK
jgi:hypothetical protein